VDLASPVRELAEASPAATLPVPAAREWAAAIVLAAARSLPTGRTSGRVYLGSVLAAAIVQVNLDRGRAIAPM
jgi:hypothetical protein